MMSAILAFEFGPAAAGLAPLPLAPSLSAATCEVLREVLIVDETGVQRPIHIPVERPLTVVLDGRELVTLMTLGGAPEFMVLGFLLNQRFIRVAAEIESIRVAWESGRAIVTSNGGAHSGGHRAAATGSGQGSVFVDLMADIDSMRLPPPAECRVDQATLLRVLDTMRQHDAIHRAAGSVHSCALFKGPDLLVCVEDVGRHNGVDTLSGWMALHGVTGADKIIFSTGRLTSEMVMKAALSGIPIAVSRNGVSSMGYDVAARLGMTLFGRAAKSRFLCYTGMERFDAEEFAP